MKVLRIAIILISFIALIVSGYFLYVYNKYQPTYEGEQQLSGLSAEVTVSFDEWGVPHIKATSSEDAFRALGYVHAQERLFQMDVLRRVGSGQLAAFFGKDLLKVDRFFRTLGTNKLAERSNERWMNDSVTRPYVALSKAYIDGINQYIQTGQQSLEYELLGVAPEPFSTLDLHYTVAYMSYSFAVALKEDPLVDHIQKHLGNEYMEALVPNHAPYFHTLGTTFEGDTGIIESVNQILGAMPTPPFLGSNSWVISGSKTKSGKVLFANDTHIGFSQPSVWFEAHIESPDVSLYGNFLAGFPFPLVGHTRDHAWGLTMFENDDMDLYAETIRDGKVNYKGQWIPLKTREETIKVKDEADDVITVEETPHGPIISSVNELTGAQGNAISVYWTMDKFETRAPEVAYGFAFSKSMEEFRSYLPLLHAPGLNVMYGDETGNVAWWATAKLIKRPDHVNSKLILDGASGKDDPLGWYHFDNNPHAVNPEWGFVHSANNQPDRLAVDSIYYPGYYYHGSRSEAIYNALSMKSNWDVKSTQQLLLNNQNTNYVKNLAIMLEAVSPRNEVDKTALEILSTWNGKHSLNDKAPVLYYSLTYQVIKQAMGDELDSLHLASYTNSFFRLRSFPQFISSATSPWWDDNNTTEMESREKIFQRAFEAAVDQVVAAHGNQPENWAWQNAHIVTYEHPMGKVEPLDKLFNVGPLAIESGEEVINKLSFNIDGSSHYKVKAGPAMRIAIDFADVDKAESVLPTGNSGRVFSPHYQNQAELYRSGKFRPMYMDIESIPNKTVLTLMP